MKLTRSNLQSCLKDLGEESSVQEQTGQLVSVLKHEQFEFPTFFRIAEEGPILQVVTFFPFTYTPDTVGDTGRMLHLLNKEIDLPGFGMDETSKTLFYRTAVTCRDSDLSPADLETALNARKLSCSSFGGVIAAVASGSITYDQAVKKAAQG